MVSESSNGCCNVAPERTEIEWPERSNQKRGKLGKAKSSFSNKTLFVVVEDEAIVVVKDEAIVVVEDEAIVVVESEGPCFFFLFPDDS